MESPHNEIGYGVKKPTYKVLAGDLDICNKVKDWLMTKRICGVLYTEDEAKKMAWELYNELGEEYAGRCMRWALRAGDWKMFCRDARSKKRQIVKQGAHKQDKTLPHADGELSQDDVKGN